MFCGFAGIGYLLALVALFSTTACTVESRMHDYGIRSALGAAPRALRIHVLGQCRRGHCRRSVSQPVGQTRWQSLGHGG